MTNIVSLLAGKVTSSILFHKKHEKGRREKKQTNKHNKETNQQTNKEEIKKLSRHIVDFIKINNV